MLVFFIILASFLLENYSKILFQKYDNLPFGGKFFLKREYSYKYGKT